MPIALGGVAALVAVAVVTVRIVAADAGGCSGGTQVRVVATPEIAPVLQNIAARWTARKPAVNGRCVRVSVEADASAKVASALTVYAGRAIDVAATPEPTPREEALPTVWVPDSTAWLTRVQAIDGTAFDDDVRSVATSPVVMAMPEAAAKLVGWPAQRLQIAALKGLLGGASGLKLGIAEPRRETASLAATMVLSEALASTDADLPVLVKTLRGVVHTTSTTELLRSFGQNLNAGPASEQAVLAYDTTNPAVKLVAVLLDPASPMLDYPFAIRSGLPRDTMLAAAAFREALQQGSAVEELSRAAFRTATCEVGQGFPASSGSTGEAVACSPVSDLERVQRALGLWTAANSPSRTLALFDLTSSMTQSMQTSTGGASRLQVMVQAAEKGLDLFTSDSRVGMWAFAAQHQEVLPIGDLTPESKAEFKQAMANVVPLPTNQAALYDTMVAAYKTMQEGYDPARPNIIVVLTDGGDSNAGGANWQRFQLELQRLADATKPIRVVLIGIDAGPADAADLQSIAKAAGGGYFPLTSPEQIQTIFLRALLQVGSV
jgi:Bacterial extracellular solute-binding protein/von Willebrand factor type A domain